MGSLWVNGELTSPSKVGSNDGLGFGRFNEPNLDIHAYELFVPADELTAALSDRFDALVAEMKTDDLLDVEPSALRRMSYPSLAGAFCHPIELEEVIRDHLHRDILQIFTPFSASTELIINSTDEIRVTDRGVTLIGRCFRKRAST
jgi:hypothetical protein